MFSVWLLSAAIILGVLVNQKGRLTGLPRFGAEGMHRNISLLALAFVAVHVLTVVIDPYVNTSVADVFIPFVSSYKPVWTGLGAVSADLFAAVIITSLVRQRIGHRMWLAIHWLVYVAWPGALIHGLGTATDLRSGWEFGLTCACVVGVGLAASWRLAAAIRAVPRGRRTASILAEIHPAPGQPTALPGSPGPPPAGQVPPVTTQRTIP